MKPRLDETLASVAEQTFESLAFMFPMEDEAPADPARPRLTSAVPFSGPFGGSLAVTVDEAALPMLAANMLGLDPDSPPTRVQQEDALREMANVICGNLLPAIAGTEAVFYVGAPEIAAGPSAAPVASAHLALDAGPVDLALAVEGEVPAALQESPRP